MRAKSSVSSAAARRTEKKGKSTMVRLSRSQIKRRLGQMKFPPTPLRKIDFSDIPEIKKEDLKHARRVGPGRPPIGEHARKLISIKIDPSILERLKREATQLGTGYQTLIHKVLERYLKGQR